MRREAFQRVFADWPDDDFKTFTELFDRFVHDYERTIPVLMTERGLGIRAGGEK